MSDLYPVIFERARTMMFVDGENFAIRYRAMAKALEDRQAQVWKEGVWEDPGVAVWAQVLNPQGYRTAESSTRMVRKYYYTSVQGDEQRRSEVTAWLKARGFEAPRVFARDRNRGSKQVDITLATDMLTHAHRQHYEIAILVAGDEDYIPLVRAVKAEGARVHVWSLTNGLSPKLPIEADAFVVLDSYLRL
jgi:uncharacterized LabA/DUF88 family protein